MYEFYYKKYIYFKASKERYVFIVIVSEFNLWRMLYHLIPENVFWNGIRTYIFKQ